ncbi:hypothetical protein FEM48_Zijuj01G0034600 [Ziziphus jujuba var. spinosa]|uniref:Transmembrane protein n=1 Tax=Ziziphus jujuba var. spinosa TaxID=714518 RepID=A0A978VYW2_ZIZJJ|nr:hypothetical protein FEM48_Zijuj01G0034600 [Ziziphus jujuba var. spinosa]
MSIKYISLLSFFILAFACFVQSARHFVHANYLMSMPYADIPVENVELAVIRGSNFWSLGLRALCSALNLLLWFFGPIPMFVSSIVMVTALYHLDTNTRPLHRHQYPQKKVGVRSTETAMTIKPTAQPQVLWGKMGKEESTNSKMGKIVDRNVIELTFL